MAYNLRFIKRALYKLKRRYGLPIELVWRTSSTPNLETGKKTVTTDSLSVNRVIVLPSQIGREFAYDLTFIASNKNFTYGGLFDKTRRHLIVDRADLPSGFEIKVGYYLILNGRRYEVEKVDEFEHNLAFGLDVKQILNSDLENLIKRHLYSFLPIDHEVEVILNDG